MRLAIVGATGLVGKTMIRVLEEREPQLQPLSEIVCLASMRSAGSTVHYKGHALPVYAVATDAFLDVDYVLMATGSDISRIYSPAAIASGSVVIDNSSAYRMQEDVPLVVPEVNPEDAPHHRGLIANPNCSTIQLVVALHPLSQAFGLRRVVVSTYQSITGAGQKGLDHLQAEVTATTPVRRISPHRLQYNTVFHSFPAGSEDTEEELKMQLETRKIMHAPDLRIAATCVRVPIIGGHGESVALEFDRPVEPEEAREVLRRAPGITVLDDPSHDLYPMPQSARDHDDVFVGRIRKDPSCDNGLLMWVVADNLRKGAATNAIQILELLNHREKPQEQQHVA